MRGRWQSMVASATIGVHEFLRAERADACGVAEIAGVARMLYSMHYTRVTMVSV